MIEIILDPTLKKLNKIQHAFFTRKGGVSTGIYASLNCALPSPDSLDNVVENRRLAMEFIDQTPQSLVSVKNVHGNTAVIVDRIWSDNEKPKADAMVTNLSQVVLGSDSADCPIILFADEVAAVIGIAHAGWRGAKSGIIEATVTKMMMLGSQQKNIYAAISPCIAQDSYEVTADFRQDFLNDDITNQTFFSTTSKPTHFLFDLPAYVKKRLLTLNLKSVSIESALDTYTHEDKFFSCRRAFHKGEIGFGGQLTCIAKM